MLLNLKSNFTNVLSARQPALEVEKKCYHGTLIAVRTPLSLLSQVQPKSLGEHWELSSGSGQKQADKGLLVLSELKTTMHCDPYWPCDILYGVSQKRSGGIVWSRPRKWARVAYRSTSSPGISYAEGTYYESAKRTLLPRCIECKRGLAMRKLSVRLSVCPTNAWIVTKRRKICPDFYTFRKNI